MSLGRVQSRGRWQCRLVRFQKAQTWCWLDMAGTAQNGSKFEAVMVREKVISGQRLWYYLFTISLCNMLFWSSDMFGSYCAILFGWLIIAVRQRLFLFPTHCALQRLFVSPLCPPKFRHFHAWCTDENPCAENSGTSKDSWLDFSHLFLRNSQSGSRFTPVHP